MNPLLVYTAAAFAFAPDMAAHHTALQAVGCQPVDAWASYGQPDLTLPVDVLRQMTAGATSTVLSAHALLLNNETSDADAVALAGYAYTVGLPVVWCGNPRLAAYQSGIHVATDLSEGVAYLASLVRAMQLTIDTGDLYSIRRAIREYIG